MLSADIFSRASYDVVRHICKFAFLPGFILKDNYSICVLPYIFFSLKIQYVLYTLNEESTADVVYSFIERGSLLNIDFWDNRWMFLVCIGVTTWQTLIENPEHLTLYKALSLERTWTVFCDSAKLWTRSVQRRITQRGYCECVDARDRVECRAFSVWSTELLIVTEPLLSVEAEELCNNAVVNHNHLAWPRNYWRSLYFVSQNLYTTFLETCRNDYEELKFVINWLIFTFSHRYYCRQYNPADINTVVPKLIIGPILFKFAINSSRRERI